MQHIPSSSLATLESRLSYTLSFLSFDPSTDGAAIHASAPLLTPLIPTLLDGIYTKLLTYDITAASFLPKLGHELDASSSSAPSSPQELSLQHPHIRRQMSFLRGYITRIAGNEDWSPESPLWGYMDKVAAMHTGEPGFKYRAKRPELRVEFVHLGLLLGWVGDMIVGAVMALEGVVDLQTKAAVVRAWSKVLWVQNDLFGRYYVKDVSGVRGKVLVGGGGGGKGTAAVASLENKLGNGTARRDLVMAMGGAALVVLFLAFAEVSLQSSPWDLDR